MFIPIGTGVLWYETAHDTPFLVGKTLPANASHSDAGGCTQCVVSHIDKKTNQETITLITCGGDFNTVIREYSHRQVVVAKRIQ